MKIPVLTAVAEHIAKLGPGAQRAIAAVPIIGGSAISLPVAALILDRPGIDENFIFPGQLAGVAAVSALTGATFPKIAGATASHGRGALVGAAAGVATALVSDAVFLGAMAG